MVPETRVFRTADGEDLVILAFARNNKDDHPLGLC